MSAGTAPRCSSRRAMTPTLPFPNVTATNCRNSSMRISSLSSTATSTARRPTRSTGNTSRPKIRPMTCTASGRSSRRSIRASGSPRASARAARRRCSTPPSSPATWISTFPMWVPSAGPSRTSASNPISHRWEPPGAVPPCGRCRPSSSAAKPTCCPLSAPSATRRAIRSASPWRRSSTTARWRWASPSGSGDSILRNSPRRRLRTRCCSTSCSPAPGRTTSPWVTRRPPSSCRRPASWATIPTMRSPSAPTRRSIRGTTCAVSSSPRSCAM